MKSKISAFAIALTATAASAGSLNIAGGMEQSMGSTGACFEGGIEYTFNGGTDGTLTISLTNMTDLSVGGYLTGFVFNIDSVDAGASASLLSTTDADFLDTGAENAAPFGMFMAGAALGANWEGGGNPSNGIAMGVTETFVFSVSASDASTLDAINFIGNTGDNFAVRFRGLHNGDSDKVSTIPAPGTGALAMLGLGIASRRRR